MGIHGKNPWFASFHENLDSPKVPKNAICNIVDIQTLISPYLLAWFLPSWFLLTALNLCRELFWWIIDFFALESWLSEKSKFFCCWFLSKFKFVFLSYYVLVFLQVAIESFRSVEKSSGEKPLILFRCMRVLMVRNFEKNCLSVFLLDVATHISAELLASFRASWCWSKRIFFWSNTRFESYWLSSLRQNLDSSIFRNCTNYSNQRIILKYRLPPKSRRFLLLEECWCY